MNSSSKLIMPNSQVNSLEQYSSIVSNPFIQFVMKYVTDNFFSDWLSLCFQLNCWNRMPYITCSIFISRLACLHMCYTTSSYFKVWRFLFQYSFITILSLFFRYVSATWVLESMACANAINHWRRVKTLKKVNIYFIQTMLYWFLFQL